MEENNTRTEADSLGEKEVASSAYYGIQTLRATENFGVTGYKLSPYLIKALAVVKKVAATANLNVGMLDQTTAEAIIWAAQEIINGGYHDQFVVDPIQGGAGTSINMNANEVIANLALVRLNQPKGSYNIVSPNNHVNMAQSTNDAFPTAGHIAMLDMLDILLNTILQLCTAFNDKATEFDNIIKMGRTHLQDAVPIRLGQEFAAYAAVLGRDHRRISTAKEELYTINIGATAVGTGLNALPDYVVTAVKLLKEETSHPLKLADNLVDSTQNTDSYTTVSAALKICMTNLSKIANDLRLMASGPRAGLFEINLPPRQPGSSIMPGKVNPVMPELINQIAFQVIGNDHTITMASEAGQFELNVMEPVIFFNLIESLQIMTKGIDSFNYLCVKDISANREVLQAYVDNSIGIITAVNPHIGYENASLVAKEALATGRTVREICIEHGFLTEDQLDRILRPQEMTHPGIAGKELLDKK